MSIYSSSESQMLKYVQIGVEYYSLGGLIIN